MGHDPDVGCAMRYLMSYTKYDNTCQHQLQTIHCGRVLTLQLEPDADDLTFLVTTTRIANPESRLAQIWQNLIYRIK